MTCLEAHGKATAYDIRQHAGHQRIETSHEYVDLGLGLLDSPTHLLPKFLLGEGYIQARCETAHTTSGPFGRNQVDAHQKALVGDNRSATFGKPAFEYTIAVDESGRAKSAISNETSSRGPGLECCRGAFGLGAWSVALSCPGFSGG